MTQFFPPDYAPTGQLIDELTQFLGLQGVEVDVFSGQPGYAFRASSAPSIEWRNRVRVKRSRVAQLWPQRIRGKAINGLLYFVRAGFFLLKNYRQYNVLLLTTAPPFLQVLGYLAYRLLGLPYVCLIYDLYPDVAVELGVVSSTHWLARFWRSINCHVWRQAKGIIVLSSSMKQRIVGYCPDVEHKTSVVHSWSDPQWIMPISKQRNWFAWKHELVECFTVLYSGNMGRCHDIDTILEAIAQLKYEPIRFVFIGGGPKRVEFMEAVQRLELANCLFLPYQEKEVLPYSLTACDLALVSISAGMENLVAPSKLYSALSAGRPIAAICPKDSYLNQLITEADCGSTFENGDSRGLAEFIRFLCRDAKAAEQMGDNGRGYLKQNFAPNIITQQYLKVLQRAINIEEVEPQFPSLPRRTPATSSTPES
jgi:glycosyltransferase involved in cell wall biosynthesis